LFVLQMKEEREEGIGTFLTIRHKSPAKVGSMVQIVARLKEVSGSSVIAPGEPL
jgi:predicted thioesterase